MLKEILKPILRVFAGTIVFLALAATIGIPAGKRRLTVAQPGDAPKELDLQGLAQDHVTPGDVPRWLPLAAQR